MTLRVYLINNDGTTDFIDYGLESSNYKGILKTEIREDSTKVKAWSGSKYVGIPEIDHPPKPKTKKSNKKKIPEYEIFNYKVHDTERDYYWVSALCSNCNESCQVAIPQKQKIDKRGFRYLSCRKCGCEKSLHYAKWDGKKYRTVTK